MGLQTVFSDNLNPAGANLSSAFVDATAFFIEVPSINVELEIDVFLQIYIEGLNGEVVRNVPLGRISEAAVLLNITDTETSLAIPYEYVNTGFTMRLLFLASSNVFLYAYVIQPDCTLNGVCSSLDSISSRLTRIESALEINRPVPSSTTTQQQFFGLQ